MKDEKETSELIRAANDALEKSETALKRMGELAMLAASDAVDDAERARLQKEMAYWVGELDYIGNNTECNGQKPLDGSVQGVFTPFGWDKCVHVSEV